MILSCSSIKKSYMNQDVLKNISFKIDDHDKCAIIGVNGAGKSTLLRIITQEEEPDSGDLIINKQMSIGYLSQEHRFDLDKSIYDTLMEPFDYLIDIEKKLRQLEIDMSSNNNLDEIMSQYDHYTHIFEDNGGYEMESLVKGILTGLGFKEDMWDKPMGILSGGQKTRIGLGQLLLTQPDLLLLDEPTNHLDLDSISWLENYLKNYRKAIIVVTHDRYFIDQCMNQIIEIENGKSTVYKCKYDEYASIKKHQRDVELKHYLNNQKEIKRMQESIQLLKSFNREKQVRRAESKEKALNKLEKVDKPDSLPASIRVQFDPEIESGFDVLQVQDVSMAFDKPLFEHFNCDIKKGQRVALLGPNGVGKTTLFHLLLRDYYPLSGEINFGVKVIVGYYDQEQESLSFDKTIFDEIHDAYPMMTNTEIRNLCATFLFKGEDVFKTIDMLSGGEKGRIVLMKLLLKKANFLLLDEPTNHLDIQSKEVLEDALDHFPGTIFFISHDRYFINKIATHIIEMTPHESKFYDGNYDDYYTHRQPLVKQEKTKKTIQKTNNKNKIKNLEKEISELEEIIKEKEQLLLQDHIIQDYEEYNKISDDLEKFNTLLLEKIEEWEAMQ